jgi:hypothetical protein
MFVDLELLKKKKNVLLRLKPSFSTSQPASPRHVMPRRHSRHGLVAAGVHKWGLGSARL